MIIFPKNLPPRAEFNNEIESLVNLSLLFDSMTMYAFADRLEALATALKEAHKPIVEQEILMSGVKTYATEFDTFTIRETIEYDYLDDKQLSVYEGEKMIVETQLEPFQSKLKGIQESIKARQKQLVDGGAVITLNAKHSISVKKK